MKKSLLVVIDVQNGFVSDATQHVVPRLESLIRTCRFDDIVCTQFINTDDSPYERLIGWSRLKDPHEQAIAELITAAVSNGRVWRKTVYTSVDDRLLDLIRRERYDAVYLTGVDTDCCVMTTAIDLFQANIRPIVLAHYCASNGGPTSHAAALKVLQRCIGPRQIHHAALNSIEDVEQP